MKHIRALFCILIFFGTVFVDLNAQTNLYVYSKSGTETPFILSRIRKLTFDAENMVVSNKDATSSTFLISEVQTMTFNIKTALPEIIDYQSSKMILFPNPVIDELHFQHLSLTSEKVKIQIVDLSGKVALQETLSNHIGLNNNTLPVSRLQHGLYIFRLLNGTQFETSKFLKE